MSDQSALLSLPYILPAQAQKHVTHNEALRILDAVVQLCVESRSLTAPPASPVDGERHIVAGPATGGWAGQDGAVAVFEAGGWLFLPPQAGWRAYVVDEGQEVIWLSGGWHGLIQRDDTAAGGVLRLPDGTQLCWRQISADAAGDVTWTYPLAFVSAPVVTATAQSGGAHVASIQAPTLTAVDVSVYDLTGARVTQPAALIATGRWK